ncbi:pentapeptide repeat-containing protein [Actinoplanes derwentensis]|uniref:Pentapeptide repeat-containing protein n=1 Tax=Actinoplanes derwentensis TaxID=113562 RepID=A0A1H2CTG6_9ACTN|nr:pentapeptide repeat-containing protein [Actinoplanes derwentensis]GID81837.1 hypothetical protein Ade03nite_07610 [Actinoplanes derwentensis]SDT73805.1 Pentapeptide repeat-containing protein [Actinoplanes derwentensis]
MAPSDEALTWQRRADDWAQQAEVEPYNGGGQAIEPANRWSAEVSTTGRPTFPADGAGWRTQTAEWRATGARWRQTTEWRSSTGSHVWRSTTESWQGDDEDEPNGRDPGSRDLSSRDQPAITGTAWPTPGAEPEPEIPSWRQAPADQTPSWRQSAADQTTSGRQSAAEQTPSWRQSATDQPSWRQSAPDPAPSWQQSPAPASPDPTPSWRQSAPEPAPSWRQSEPETPPRQRYDPDNSGSWQRNDPDNSASWQRSDPDNSTSWRRRSDGPSATTPVEQTWSSGSSSWQQPSAQTPSWQQPSGRTPSWQEPSTPAPSWQQPQQTPSWQQPSGSGQSRRRDEDSGSWSTAPVSGTSRSDRADRTPPGENTGGITRWERTDAPGWQRSAADDARHLVREDDRAAWRREADYSERPTRAGRRRAAESGTAPSGGTGWTSGSETTGGWAGHTDTGNITAFSGPGDGPAAPSWGTRSGTPSRRDRRRAEETRPEPARADLSRTDPSRADQSRADLSRTDLSRADLSRADLSRADQSRADQSRADLSRAELSRADLSRADLSRGDLSRPDQSRIDQSRTDLGRPDRSRTDLGRPEDTGRREAGAKRGPGQSRPRYNANPTNWREDTASWDGDQDTSNWTRDPDTGQWSRAEDDPRVLAWRAEAARRDAVKPAPEPEEEPTGRRARRGEPSGGVPGGPMPDARADGGPGWPTSAVPNNAPSGDMPGNRPRSAMPGPGALPGPPDDGRRRRGEEPTGWRGEDPAGRRRAGDAGPGPQRFDEPMGAESWRSEPEPRSGRRRGGAPEEYPSPDGGRPGPRPPQWQDPDPRRSGYQDESPADDPRWQQEPSGYEQSYPPPQQRRSGFGSARELPAGPPAQPQRPAFGGPQRELPAGPSAQPQRPAFGGPQRELPAGPSAYGDSNPSPVAPASSAAPSWADQERQQRPGNAPSWADQERPDRQDRSGGPSWADQERPDRSGGSSWADQERQDRQQRSGGPSWDDQERPQRPVSSPAWADQERGQQSAQRAAYGAPGTDSSWSDQERRPDPSRAEPDRRPPAQRPGGEPSWNQPARPVSGPAWRDQEQQQGPSYGGPRIPSQSPGYDAPGGGGSRRPEQAEPGRPAYGARELPAGSAAPSWTEQQKPAYGPAADELTARWPDPLSEQPPARRGYDDRDDPPPAGGGFGGRPPLADWLAAERADRRGADYRSAGAGQDGETDWRRQLSGEPTEGESRRYSTSDFPPFRPSGSASVDGTSNLALSATSVISLAPGAGAADALPSGGGTALAVEEDTSWPPRRSTGAFQGTGSYERRPVSDDYFTTSTAPGDLLDPDDDEEEEETGSPLAAVGYTAVWYGIPVVLFGVGILLLDSGQRTNALNTLTDAAPGFGIALVVSMMLAYGLRSITTAWKSASVGLAAAVVGGGLATVLSSAISGNSLS